MPRFLSGLSFGLVLGAGLMWLWAPVFQPRSPQHVAAGVSEPASVARSQASRPDVVVEIVPSAGRLQAGEPALIASEAVGSDTVIEAEAFLARLEAPEPNPSWQVPVLAPNLARSAVVPIHSPRKAPVLPAPEASPSEVPSAISTSPAEAPDSVLDLSEIELVQPVEGTPEPATVAAKPALPESFRDVAVAEPVTSAPTIPEAAEAAIAGAEPTRSEARVIGRLVRSRVPQCNIEVCAAYRAFRASDCTYKLVEGPRQLCPEEAETARPVRSEAPQCNIEVCATAYRSFRASDCTYQPFEGPRQLCTR